MTAIFGAWTLGAALLYSAIKNMTLVELIKGEAGPGQPESIVDSILGGSLPSSEGEGFSLEGNIPKNRATALARGYRAIMSIAGKYPYSWGGGHQQFCKPSGKSENGGVGFDCSGAWSCPLGAMGIISAPMTSGEMAAHFEKGPGKYITLYANDVHVFGKFLGRWFATGSDKEAKRGGPAWGNHDTTAGYTQCHPRGW